MYLMFLLSNNLRSIGVNSSLKLCQNQALKLILEYIHLCMYVCIWLGDLLIASLPQKILTYLNCLSNLDLALVSGIYHNPPKNYFFFYFSKFDVEWVSKACLYDFINFLHFICLLVIWISVCLACLFHQGINSLFHWFFVLLSSFLFY